MPEKPTIQRYDSPVGYMDRCRTGEFVYYDDLAPYVQAKVDEARQQVIDEMVKPLMVELRYAGKEAGGFTKNHAEHTLAMVEAKIKDMK